jgi:hypothetical protein
MAGGKHHEPGGRLLPMEDRDGSIQDIREPEGPAAGKDARDACLAVWVQELGEQDLGRFTQGRVREWIVRFQSARSYQIRDNQSRLHRKKPFLEIH